ncbi:hypothetical protein ACWC09_20795 [Streptomyces sp. NPDC001617]
MNEHDTDVLDALRASLADVTLDTPLETIVADGRARRRGRRIALTAGATAVAAGLALGVPSYGHPSTAPPTSSGALATGAGTVHIRTAAYTIDSLKSGALRVSWDKQAYFDDHAGLEKALHEAGFPVQMKVGEFCKGPNDDGKLEHGVGTGVDQVMKGRRVADDKVTFDFFPDAMPAHTELFIGYLDSAQLAITGGRPGSVERLVPTDQPLTCTTELPSDSP